MGNGDSKLLYRHSGTAVLRTTAVATQDGPCRWPDLGNSHDCRSWLQEVWLQPRLAIAVRHASIGLAKQVDAICSGMNLSDKQIRRATLSTVRYFLRLTGRQMPFGLFAGVASAGLGTRTAMRWRAEHRSLVRADAEWLNDVVTQMEASAELLDRLDVVFTNLAAQRGDDLDIPRGTTRVVIRRTRPIQAVQERSQSPIGLGVLVRELAERFAGVPESTVRGLVTGLVQQGFLITSLRAPATITDPLAYVIRQLHAADAGAIDAIAPVLADLEAIESRVAQHNQPEASEDEQAEIRAWLATQTRRLSTAGRTPLAADLRLDCDVQLPEQVAVEIARAATALMKLTRQPTGTAVWRDYYTAFCDRYGINALIPLSDVVNPATGLGLPATYPGSTLTTSQSGPSERDERLIALAWGAMADNSREIVLTDQIIQTLEVGDPSIERPIPPHVELAVQIRAKSTDALDRGDYTLVVHPGRSAGTFTSRLAYLTPDAGLQDVYRGVPTAVDGALPVQVSFPPAFAHAENICRVPAYLPHVLSMGEHRADNEDTISLDDLAITATRSRLRLISISRRRVVEPQFFHALALEKQTPPLARFLAHLSHGLGAVWQRFDWGPAAQQLPYLPRVRYRRSILSPATWRLTAAEIPSTADDHHWLAAVEDWRQRWACPATVELQDADRSLPLTLSEPAHAAIVRTHLNRHGVVVFAETTEASDFGWIDGHAHDIAIPLVSTRTPAPAPAAATGWTVSNHGHGQLAASPSARWLYLKLHTDPEQMGSLIATELPGLLDNIDQPDYWFARYRSPRETDHLRLRLRIHSPEHSTRSLTAVSVWAEQLRDEGKLGRLVIDTYYPENGRYGHGPAMTAAEAVFVADSQLVAAQLRQLPGTAIDPSGLTALNMLGTVDGFFGDLAPACAWLTSTPAPADTVADRSLTDQVVTVAREGLPRGIPSWNTELSDAWRRRADALGIYRRQLPDTARVNDVLESLLHMHHNRAIGIDREGEAVCRRLARQAAVAWSAQATGVSQ